MSLLSACLPLCLSELSANKTSEINKCLWICVLSASMNLYPNSNWNPKPNLEPAHSVGSANQIKYNTNIYLPWQNTVRKGKHRWKVERVTKRRRVWRNEHECISQIHLRALSYLSLHARFAVRCVDTAAFNLFWTHQRSTRRNVNEPAALCFTCCMSTSSRGCK